MAAMRVKRPTRAAVARSLRELGGILWKPPDKNETADSGRPPDRGDDDAPGLAGTEASKAKRDSRRRNHSMSLALRSLSAWLCILFGWAL